jgi:hypothetical protein
MTQSSIAAATSVATPNTQADATSQPESPESTLNTPVADTSATATTNPAAGISAPAIVDATVDTGPAAAQSALPIDAAQSLAIDPSVAAAVAAYRVNVLGATLNNMPDSLPKPVSDIAAVSRIQPASLDPHDESAQSRRNEAARNAVQALAQRKVSHKFPG